MYKTYKNAATSLPVIRKIIQSDIVFLKNMLKNRSSESQSYKLIESLIRVKIKIYEMIPNNKYGAAQIPGTDSGLIVTSYNDNEPKDFQDQSMLLKMFLKLENEQLKFVKRSLRSDNINKDVVAILEKILNIYIHITNQIDRAYKTSQVNPLVIN